MRASPMLEFPLSEYEQRISGLVARMNAAGIDGVMITSKESTRYYTGLQSVIWPSKLSTPGIVLVSASGDVYIVGSASAQDTARYSACVEDENVIAFNRIGIPGVAPTYTQAIMDTMRKMGLAKGKLGMEIGAGTRLHLQMQWMDVIRREMKDMTFVDASQFIWEQRMVKSPAEIEVFRKLCEINDHCYHHAFTHVELGKTTEMDLYRIFAQEAFRLHCEDMPSMGFLFGEGRYLNGNCPPSDTIVITNTPHAVLQIDGGPMYKGYYADIIRMAVVGGMTAEQQALMDASYDILYFALGQIRAGANAKEICSKMDARVAAGPSASYYRMYTWAGHGIGMDLHEPPTIATGCDMELKAGMILAVEPVFGDAKLGVFGNEQNILVTETGCEVLSKLSIEPYILK